MSTTTIQPHRIIGTLASLLLDEAPGSYPLDETLVLKGLTFDEVDAVHRFITLTREENDRAYSDSVAIRRTDVVSALAAGLTGLRLVTLYCRSGARRGNVLVVGLGAQEATISLSPDTSMVIGLDEIDRVELEPETPAVLADPASPENAETIRRLHGLAVES